MKQLLVLIGCAVVVSAVAGCREPQTGVEVIVEGGKPFPEFLAGRWTSETRGWEFVFEPDGTISSAVIDSGLVRVSPSRRITTFQLKDGGKGLYKLGRWTVQYAPSGRELAVEVVVDYYHLEMKDLGMKGSSTDWFVGPVSTDGQSWQAEWFTFPKLTAYARDEQDLVFDQDPNDNPIATLVFKKQK